MFTLAHYALGIASSLALFSYPKITFSWVLVECSRSYRFQMECRQFAELLSKAFYNLLLEDSLDSVGLLESLWFVVQTDSN
jgi:hypothetical protein